MAAQLQQEAALHVLVVPESGWPAVVSFATTAELEDYVRARVGEAVALYPFLGVQLRIASKPFRYLATPFGRLPLLDPAQAAEEFDPFLGERVEPVESPVPAQESSQGNLPMADQDDPDEDELEDSEDETE